MSRPVVVVVGAGMAGLTAAHRLAPVCEVVVVDKARGVGGRLATRRIGDATFDHGAQFVTTHTAEFAATVGRLVEDGVITPWFRGRIGPTGTLDPDGHVRYRGSPSMNAIAKHLAVGLDVRTSSPVTAIEQNDDAWRVSFADGSRLEADGVIATAPVPQTLSLLANGGVVLSPPDATALAAIEYDPCLAVMVVLDGPSGLVAPGAVDPIDGPIDWMADNRSKGVSAVPAVTIHASAAFSREHWDAPDASILDTLLAAARLDAAAVPGASQVQRWRYARPSVAHDRRCLSIDAPAPLVCAGDAFGGAKVEGAALSGAEAGRVMTEALGLD